MSSSSSPSSDDDSASVPPPPRIEIKHGEDREDDDESWKKTALAWLERECKLGTIAPSATVADVLRKKRSRRDENDDKFGSLPSVKSSVEDVDEIAGDSSAVGNTKVKARYHSSPVAQKKRPRYSKSMFYVSATAADHDSSSESEDSDAVFDDLCTSNSVFLKSDDAHSQHSTQNEPSTEEQLEDRDTAVAPARNSVLVDETRFLVRQRVLEEEPGNEYHCWNEIYHELCTEGSILFEYVNNLSTSINDSNAAITLVMERYFLMKREQLQRDAPSRNSDTDTLVNETRFLVHLRKSEQPDKDHWNEIYNELCIERSILFKYVNDLSASMAPAVALRLVLDRYSLMKREQLHSSPRTNCQPAATCR